MRVLIACASLVPKEISPSKNPSFPITVSGGFERGRNYVLDNLRHRCLLELQRSEFIMNSSMTYFWQITSPKIGFYDLPEIPCRTPLALYWLGEC